MKMPIINFDDRFADFMSDWVKNNQDKYANFDEMEEDMPRIYMAFLNKRANWLGNVTPGAYFTQFEDPKVLVDWLAQYCEDGVPVPDLLCEQITTVGRPCEKRLLELLKDEEAPEEAPEEPEAPKRTAPKKSTGGKPKVPRAKKPTSKKSGNNVQTKTTGKMRSGTIREKQGTKKL